MGSTNMRTLYRFPAVLVVVAMLLGATATPARAAKTAAQVIEEKRQEAARIQDEIERQGLELARISEEYDAARVRLDQLTIRVLDAERLIDETEARSREVRTQVQTRIAALYMGAGSATVLNNFDVADVRELGARQQYASVSATKDDIALSELRTAKEELRTQQAALESAKRDALTEKNRLEKMQIEAEALQARQEATLALVTGDLEKLVAEEEARRAAEEEKRAREAIARAEAEKARQQEQDQQASLAPPPPPSERVNIAVTTAQAQIGKPYRYAASGPDEFDCSGLTMYAWAAAGISMVHSSRIQFESFPHVAREDLQPGDLVFFGDPIHHVGLYMGNGQMVNAPQTGKNVGVASIYRTDYVGAVRPG